MPATRLNLLMQRSSVHSKIKIVTHQYQRVSCSQYLPQMQESDATLTLTKMKTIYAFTHRFARIFQLTFVSTFSRKKKEFHFSQHHGLTETSLSLLDFPFTSHNTPNLGFCPKLLLQETRFDTRLVKIRCKEFTYCLCNFIWPHRSRAFMFVRLRALFKSSTEREVKKGLLYAVSLSFGVSVAGVAVCIWASVLGVASDGISLPDQLLAAVDFLVGNVWITGCTTVSIRSG
ncbi:hypothetical protein H5410_022632, partial [Solanum commersonii]